MPHGRFQTFAEAQKVAKAHLLHRCELVQKKPSKRELDIVADAGVEGIEGAA